MAARTVFEPWTLRLKGIDSTNAPPRPTLNWFHLIVYIINSGECKIRVFVLGLRVASTCRISSLVSTIRSGPRFLRESVLTASHLAPSRDTSTSLPRYDNPFIHWLSIHASVHQCVVR